MLFDLPVAVGLSRAKARSAADRIEQEEASFFERIRQCYLSRAKDEPNRFQLIDAEQTIEGVQKQLDESISLLLGKA